MFVDQIGTPEWKALSEKVKTAVECRTGVENDLRHRRDVFTAAFKDLRAAAAALVQGLPDVVFDESPDSDEFSDKPSCLGALSIAHAKAPAASSGLGSGAKISIESQWGYKESEADPNCVGKVHLYGGDCFNRWFELRTDGVWYLKHAEDRLGVDVMQATAAKTLTLEGLAQLIIDAMYPNWCLAIGAQRTIEWAESHKHE